MENGKFSENTIIDEIGIQSRKGLCMYKYKVTKTWYDDEEIIESETPLTHHEIRNRIDEQRLYCDELDVEEIEE